MGKNKKLQELELAMNSLVIFRRLLTNEVMLPLRALLDTETTDPLIQLRQYTEFVSRLYPKSTSLTEFILNLILEDDNFYVRSIGAGEKPDERIDACVQNELLILQRLSRIRPAELQKEISYYGILPEWTVSEIDFGAAFAERMRRLPQLGYGKFARSPMFLFREGQIVPVQHPDPVQLSDLTGYEAERQALLGNFRALLHGRPAQNVLLYGAPGTGKSTSVKAAVNSLAPEGLRLIQIAKEQLRDLPLIMDELNGNPLKFVLFIDDLSFSADNDRLSALKAMVEGSVCAQADNAVICATSNLQHLVRKLPDGEEPDDRQQELRSLAARFGLQIHFARPEREAYLDTVRRFAVDYGLSGDDAALCRGALQFAEEGSGCSPRTAKQYVKLLIGRQEQEASGADAIGGI